MRDAPWDSIERFRVQIEEFKHQYGDDFGIFEIPYAPTGVRLRVIVSSAAKAISEGMPPWDHVSVSLPRRCPNWPEMEFVKRLFFRDDEAAMQLHPPLSDYVSCHPYCLHIWRPTEAAIPLPPSSFVGPLALVDALKGL